jgi:hypothetical protein
LRCGRPPAFWLTVKARPLDARPCVVTPGSTADFELGDCEELVAAYPLDAELVRELSWSVSGRDMRDGLGRGRSSAAFVAQRYTLTP